MVALTIIKQIDSRIEIEFLFVDSFFGAKNVSSALDRESGFKGRVKFFKTHNQVHTHTRKAGYDRIFIDSDVGLRNFLTLLRFKTNNFQAKIAVYEEGLGTYRIDLYRGLRRFLGYFGVGIHFGGCFFTDEIFLFNCSEYRKNFPGNKTSILQIEEKIDTFITGNLLILNKIFGYSNNFFPTQSKDKNKSCLIYLTNWTIKNEVIEKLNSINCVKIIKPHPHLKNFSYKKTNTFIEIAGCIPAELLVANISNYFEEVIIYHHGSSIVRYSTVENVKFILI